MAKSEKLISNHRGSHNTDWVTVESASEVMVIITATLFSDTHSLVSNLLSLISHNAKERRVHVYWTEEYNILPMNFLRKFTINLNTWCISVYEDTGDIYQV